MGRPRVEAEGGGEVRSVLGNVVEEGDEWEELGPADGTLDDRLDKGDLDAGEARPGEDLLDAAGSGDGVLVGEGARRHTDGDDERAEGLGLLFVGVGEGVDGCPIYAHGVEVFVEVAVRLGV